MGRPKEHDEATGEALLDAAEAQLTEFGPDKLTIRGVAQATGISTRAIYSVFGSKAGLLNKLAERGYSMLADAVRRIDATDDPAADLVSAGLHAFRPFAINHPGLFRLTFERVPGGVIANAGVSRAAMNSFEALVEWIRRAQAAGRVNQQPVEEIAFMFHSLCQGLASCELSREPPPVGANFWSPVQNMSAGRLWQHGLEALVDGLGPTGSTHSGDYDADS